MAAPATPRLVSLRLRLDPLRVGDAAEMVEVLADARLYAFTGGGPPTVDQLRARYERQVGGRSPNGREAWHNWIVRLRADGTVIGTVQATIVDGGRAADIAWVIGVGAQGRGYASEAARALVRWLERRGIAAVTAHIHPEHHASAAVARNAGLHPTPLVEDGEVVWIRKRERC